MAGRAGRGRRTRVYDCNYNIGQSYYKPAIDQLDRKYSGRALDIEPLKTRPLFEERDVVGGIRDSFAGTSMQEDSFFDSRGARTSRGRPLSTAVDEDDFDDEVSSSLRRLRANKKASRFAEDLDFDSSFERPRLSDKILESVGISSDLSSAQRSLMENEERTERRIARRIRDDDSTLTKWTALNDESAASLRAKATKARLNDLEDEMMEMNEKHAAREQRAARLRALVADNEAENASSTTKISMRSEKKQVTF